MQPVVLASLPEKAAGVPYKNLAESGFKRIMMASLAFLSLLLLYLAWTTMHYWLRLEKPEDIQHDRCPLFY